MYVCTNLNALNVCTRWEEFSIFPVLASGQGMELGWLFLGVTAVAWGSKEIAILLLNRRR